MKLIPFLLFIPLLEIFLFISLSKYIGVFYILLLTVLTAFFGLLLIRKNWKLKVQGFLNQPFSSLNMNFDNLSDGIFILISGVFFITPGFITDTFGILLINSKFRGLIKRILIGYFTGFYMFKKRETNSKDEHLDVDYEEIND